MVVLTLHAAFRESVLDLFVSERRINLSHISQHFFLLKKVLCENIKSSSTASKGVFVMFSVYTRNCTNSICSFVSKEGPQRSASWTQCAADLWPSGTHTAVRARLWCHMCVKFRDLLCSVWGHGAVGGSLDLQAWCIHWQHVCVHSHLRSLTDPTLLRKHHLPLRGDVENLTMLTWLLQAAWNVVASWGHYRPKQL